MAAAAGSVWVPCVLWLQALTRTPTFAHFFFFSQASPAFSNTCNFFEVFCVGYRTDLAEVFLDILKRYLCINKGPEESQQ